MLCRLVRTADAQPPLQYRRHVHTARVGALLPLRYCYSYTRGNAHYMYNWAAPHKQCSRVHTHAHIHLTWSRLLYVARHQRGTWAACSLSAGGPPLTHLT